MKWFGKNWGSAFCTDETHEETPTGASCKWCDETIESDDDGFLSPSTEGILAFHQHCFLRQITGSLGHIQKKCSCYGGNEEDPTDMTKREAAVAAVTAWEELGV